MSVRERATEALTRHFEGTLSFNSIEDTVRLGGGGVMPETVDRDFYDRRYGGAYEAVVKTIDWNRVLLEAMGRHLELGHEVSPGGSEVEDYVCGECLEAALLTTDTFPVW